MMRARVVLYCEACHAYVNHPAHKVPGMDRVVVTVEDRYAHTREARANGRAHSG